MTGAAKPRCKNCDTVLEGPVCHQCGQRLGVERWSTATVVQQLAHSLTDIDRGFLHTALQLFARPGQVVRDYWSGKTVDYFDPARHLLIWVALNLLLNFWLGIDDIMRDALEPQALEETFGKARVDAADRQFDSWMNVLVLLLVPVNSLVSLLLFRRAGKNYGEHLILNSYSLGQQSLIGCFAQFVLFVMPTMVIGYLVFLFVLGWAYNAVLFRQTFAQVWSASVLKAFGVSFVGVCVFSGLVAAFSAIALANQAG